LGIGIGMISFAVGLVIVLFYKENLARSIRETMAASEIQ